MHGKAGSNGSPDALRELGQAIEAPDPDRSQSSDSFSQDMAGTCHTAEDPMTEFSSHPASAYCKLRSMIPAHGVSEQEKLSLDAGKLAKAPVPQTLHPAYAYSDVDAPASGEPLQADSMCMIRSSLATLDNHCGDPLGSRVAPTAYRNSEGQFFSSMTLWGLAMKTLQNEAELDQ